MARLVAGFGTSHSPMLACAAEDWTPSFLPRDKARQHYDFDGRACRYDDILALAPGDAMARIAPAEMARRRTEIDDAQARLRASIAAAALDALIVIGDDQDELFDRSNVPAIGIYHGATIRNAASGPAEDAMARARMRFFEANGDREYPCAADLAGHLIESLLAADFDISVSANVPAGRHEGHAFSYVHKFCTDAVPIVPVFLNAYYPPNQPAPRRCYALGRALAAAIDAFPTDGRIGVIASGGLSHFVVDEAFDRRIVAALRDKDAGFFQSVPEHKLLAGSSEVRNWICMAGAAEALNLDWIQYVPGYRTPALTGTGLCFASFH
jgi:Catalytic LigB subunit of aromatic ring-opening dioxygenase